ncbi:spinster family MFS transporter [Novosphingobium sp. JCM 18896]|uniref:spinster family MFS transporter n=1 Tax=Novosphingobium sp. JCM 18896 TaxID=2989731 RepID=UPI002222C7AC|nr:MFS transporter [Novosphingobium sp. JCM 18896]MCW1432284.1 MFS transporter [Novosphingobium sp. JCM 18896]
MSERIVEATDGAETSRIYVWSILTVLMLLNALNYVDRQILAVLVVPIKAELQLSNTQIGLLSGFAFATFYAICGIPIAWLADRGNRVWLLSGCLAIWSGMTALCGSAQSFGQMFLFRVGVGVGEAGCSPAAQSLISDFVPRDRRALALSFYSLGIPVGSFIGLALGGIVAQTYGWRAAFMVVGLPGLLIAIMLPFIVREPRRNAIDPQVPPPVIETLRTLLRSRAYVHTMITGSLTSVLNFGSGYFLGFFFNVVHGRSLAETGFQLAVVTGLGWAIGIGLGGLLADRAQKVHASGLGRVPAFALLIGLPFAMGGYFVEDGNLAMLLLLFPTALNSVFFGPGYAIVQGVATSRTRAMSLAIFMLVANLIGIGLGPAFVGWLTDALSNYFLGTDFALRCAGAAGALSACHAAEVQARRWALALTSLFAIWAAFHLFRASRALPDELVH